VYQIITDFFHYADVFKVKLMMEIDTDIVAAGNSGNNRMQTGLFPSPRTACINNLPMPRLRKVSFMYKESSTVSA